MSLFTHLDHCYRNEFPNSCKYGEENCPAKPLVYVFPPQGCWAGEVMSELRDTIKMFLDAHEINHTHGWVLDDAADSLLTLLSQHGGVQLDENQRLREQLLVSESERAQYKVSWEMVSKQLAEAETKVKQITVYQETASHSVAKSQLAKTIREIEELRITAHKLTGTQPERFNEVFVSGLVSWLEAAKKEIGCK